MSAKAVNRTPRRRAERRRRPTMRRARLKAFSDGSALILDERGRTIGLIEARTPYRVRKSAGSRPPTSDHQ